MKLERTSNRYNQTQPSHVQLDEVDVTLLAQNAIEEASVNGPEGMAAVTTVVLNRLNDSRWDDKVEDIILRPKQFSWTNNPKKLARTPKDYGEHWDKAVGIVMNTVAKWQSDPSYLTSGATNYYANKGRNAVKEPPSWAREMTEIGNIGDHLFLKEEKKNV